MLSIWRQTLNYRYLAVVYAPYSPMSNVTFIVMSGGLYQWQRNKHEENNQCSSSAIERTCYRSFIVSDGDGSSKHSHD